MGGGGGSWDLQLEIVKCGLHGIEVGEFKGSLVPGFEEKIWITGP